ncbi:MAG: cobalt-precorrin-5B (C(1))-methyltransferase, partial [Okeania sp. SIO2H7]|nr:cobalt-precorrin-5B (C(1))-methyltransferase [Okeania sp. SIO2H7]
SLIEPPTNADIPIEQVALLKTNLALAVTRSDPGDNLDLTRHTPIWAMVELGPRNGETQQIIIEGGEGVGRQTISGQAAIYSYARRLLKTNLKPLLREDERVTVTIILPFGRQLATRTSLEAFGVVEGLSLLGTGGISQPLTAPGQLEAFREELEKKAAVSDRLIFCIGENGLDLAQKSGLPPELILKTANWLGPMLVAAGMAGVKSLLLFGYHGKLIKLAGGIFHTHHHLADGRLEILTAHCANLGLPGELLQQIFACGTAEDALKLLRNSSWAEEVYGAIASTIDRRCKDYIRKHSQQEVKVGSVLFDRQRQIIIRSETARFF